MKVKLLTLLAEILKTAVTRKIDMTTVVIFEAFDNKLIHTYHLVVYVVLTESFVYYHKRITFSLSRMSK